MPCVRQRWCCFHFISRPQNYTSPAYPCFMILGASSIISFSPFPQKTYFQGVTTLQEFLNSHNLAELGVKHSELEEIVNKVAVGLQKGSQITFSELGTRVFWITRILVIVQGCIFFRIAKRFLMNWGIKLKNGTSKGKFIHSF